MGRAVGSEFAVIGATGARLREIAGPDLYRRNAFRITGLPTDVDRRTVRQRRQQVTAALAVGADIDPPLSVRIEQDQAPALFDLLGDEPRRLVDELFWLWGAPGATCSCARLRHRDHDAAVRAHSQALDREASVGSLSSEELGELDQLWADAARRWKLVLRSTAFWDHVRHRITVLDDRRLGASAVDLLRDAVPATLVKPVVDLAVAAPDPARQAAHARRWPVPASVLEDQLEEATAPLFDRLGTLMGEAGAAPDRCRPIDTASVVHEHVMPALRRLDAIVPHERHRRTAAARDGAATLLNNCATFLLGQSGSTAAGQARQWLDSGHELAVGDETRRTIEQNRTELDEMVRVLQIFREQISALVAAGRTAQARKAQRRLRREFGDSPVAGEIDQLLAGLSPWRPAVVRSPVWLPRLARRLAPVVGLAAVTGGLFLLWPSGTEAPATVPVFSDQVAANPPAGTCIATRELWDDRQATTTDACDDPHWGEVLGYPALSAVPSPYPGEDQVHSLSRFECGRLLAERGLRAERYAVAFAVADRAFWNDGAGRYENYATCVAHGRDGEPLPAGRVTIPDQPPREDVAVRMGLFSETLWANAPVGACVATRDSVEASSHDVPVVRCEQSHWAEILGYPMLYQPGSPWPGDEAVYAKALSACQGITSDMALPPEFTFWTIWPARDWWADPEQPIYATCLAHRTDDQSLTGSLT